jgi:hypothetical protein
VAVAVAVVAILAVVSVLLLVRMLIERRGVGEKSTCVCGRRAYGRIILLL